MQLVDSVHKLVFRIVIQSLVNVWQCPSVYLDNVYSILSYPEAKS